MRKGLRIGSVALTLTAVAVCLAVGVTAMVTAPLIAFAVSVILICDPAHLLGSVFSHRGRWMAAAAIWLILLAFLPFVPGALSAGMVVVAVLLVAFLCKFERRLKEQEMQEERSQERVIYTETSSKTLNSMLAQEGNYSQWRAHYYKRGQGELRGIFMALGMAFTEDDVDKGAIAYLLGAYEAGKAQEQNRLTAGEVQAENDQLRESLAAATAELERERNALEIARHDMARLEAALAEETRLREEWADVGRENYQAAQELRKQQVTGEKILEMIDSGMTQQEIANQTGLSKSTINRRKLEAEQARKKHEELVAGFTRREP